MELLLVTAKRDSVSTEGSLYVDEVPECFTLELPYVDGSEGSAIAAGRYQVVLLPSPKFEASTDPWVLKYARKMPHLVGVVGRSFIMIHWGNFAKDTDGCILVGSSEGIDFIGSSRDAFSKLYYLIQDAAAKGECFITIER